jgi:hypothetical protein
MQAQVNCGVKHNSRMDTPACVPAACKASVMLTSAASGLVWFSCRAVAVLMAELALPLTRETAGAPSIDASNDTLIQ